MDWVIINTILLVITLVLLVHIKRTAITAEQILLYLGLNNEEIIVIMKGDMELLIRKLEELKIKIPDRILKDFKNKKKRNERTD